MISRVVPSVRRQELPLATLATPARPILSMAIHPVSTATQWVNTLSRIAKRA